MAGVKTYGEQIAEHIKKGLLSGELVPGQKINEVTLANRLGISRAPVREALQLMVKDGLVVSIPQRGKFVRSLSAQEIRDNYDLGGVIEGVAVAKGAALLTEEDYHKLENVLDMMQAIKPSDDYAAEYSRLDKLFHSLLIARSRNQASYELGRSLCQRISKFLLYRYWPTAFTQDEFVHRHREVLKAVKTLDQWHIEMVVRKHYNDLGDKMAPYGNDE
jgi:Transcriptional regulators